MSIRSIIKQKTSHSNPWEYSANAFPKEKPGVIYVRQSTEYQREQNIHSFEMQTDKFVEHFRNMGCTGDIALVADEEKGKTSGTLDIHQRPGLTRVVELITKEKVGWVGAVQVNRLTRDPFFLTPAHLMKLCYEHDVWIVTLRMHFNFKDEYSQQVFMLEAQEAARHLKWMKLVLGGAKSIASDTGLYDGRFLVPGYIVDRTDPRRKKYIIYRPHAEIVLWLFKRFLELDGNFPALCREVEAMPYLFPPFEEWVDKKNRKLELTRIKEGSYAGAYKPSRHGLESILTNPVYIGWWIPLGGGLVVDNHEPIVDEGLFTYAHKRLSTFALTGERQKPERVSRNGKVQALLKKVIKDERGHSIYAHPEEGGRYKCFSYTGLSYQSHFSIDIARVDAPFVDKFLQKLQDWQGCEDWEDKVDQVPQSQESKKQMVRSLMQDAQEKWQAAMDVLTNPRIPKTEHMLIDLANTCAGLEAKMEQLQKDLAALEAPDEDTQEQQTLYEIHTLLPAITTKWDKLPFEMRIRFVNATTRKVVLSQVSPCRLKMEVHWKIQEWGIDIAYLWRGTSKGSDWTTREDTLLRTLYPTEDALTVMKALSDRSWQAIKCRASDLGVRRMKIRGNSVPIGGEYIDLSYNDITFAQEQAIVATEKKAQWCQELYSLSLPLQNCNQRGCTGPMVLERFCQIH